jgi:transcriptional regulator with XRE-family HTH domain
LPKSKGAGTRGPKGAVFLFAKGALAAARRSAKFTQEELAEAADLSVTTVRDAEAGKKPVSEESALAIAVALGKSLDDFRSGVTDRSTDSAARAEGTFARPDLASQADDHAPRPKFVTVAQARLEIIESKDAEEIGRMIFGRERDEQYKFIGFCRHLRSCNRAIDQVWDSFHPMRLTGLLFPKSVVLHARLAAINPTNQVAAFHIEEGAARDLSAQPTKADPPRILYEVKGGGRFELSPQQSIFADVNVACFFRYEDFEDTYWNDAWARSYLLAAQSLRDHLLRAEHAQSAIPIDLRVLFGDGARQEIRIGVQVPQMPAALKDWPCNIRGLDRALTDLHEAADPLHTLHQRRQSQLVAMRRRHLSSEEQHEVEARRNNALQRILGAASSARATGTQHDGHARSIFDEIDAYHRGAR